MNVKGLPNTNVNQNYYMMDGVTSLPQGYIVNTIVKIMSRNGLVLHVEILSTHYE